MPPQSSFLDRAVLLQTWLDGFARHMTRRQLNNPHKKDAVPITWVDLRGYAPSVQALPPWGWLIAVSQRSAILDESRDRGLSFLRADYWEGPRFYGVRL